VQEEKLQIIIRNGRQMRKEGLIALPPIKWEDEVQGKEEISSKSENGVFGGEGGGLNCGENGSFKQERSPIQPAVSQITVDSTAVSKSISGWTMQKICYAPKLNMIRSDEEDQVGIDSLSLALHLLLSCLHLVTPSYLYLLTFCSFNYLQASWLSLTQHS
jgi:hypothetical protein